MRDWILEMHGHSSKIQSTIDAGSNDEAWRLTHRFQDWCFERINAERYSQKSAGTLLSAPQTFLIRILLAEEKYTHALIHTMYQGFLDGRNLKHYPKSIKTLFNKCNFKETPVTKALELYDHLKSQSCDFNQSFQAIRDTVSSWK
jgi:hypothetical protein